MAPSADMFEMGVKVQVLRKGTFFAPRAARLTRLRAYDSLEELPPTLAATLDATCSAARSRRSGRRPSATSPPAIPRG